MGFTKTVMTVNGWRFNEVRTMQNVSEPLDLLRFLVNMMGAHPLTQIEMSFMQCTHLIQPKT